ncbi:MAG: sigma-70 family RNA polymerase sigma factor [Gemmataceae bacterium]|nr:sigma-70 family RNA polymerase sigma factor [Gemmataceae bacterium]
MGRSPFARWLRGRPPEPGEPVPDAELLARFAGAGDEAAFELLVWRHAALVLGVCRRVVRDDHLAEDAFQATFLVLARKAGSVRGANLSGWLFRVARRVAARTRRQAESRAKWETSLTAEPEGAPLPCPIEAREFLADLDEEVARLPERLRRPVLLCYLGGRTTEDAARALGCPRGTVLSRLATARQRLADRLTRRGVTLPAGALGTVAVPTVSGVVPPAVRASLAFVVTGSGLPSTNPTLLANGALTAMKLGKTLTAGVVVILTAGLLGGYALVARPGDDPVAARAADEPPKPTASAKTADPPRPAGPAAKKPDPDPEARVREDSRRLDELTRAGELMRREIEQLQRRIDELNQAGGVVDPETQRWRTELAARSRELDRELLVEEVRELAKSERAARRRLADAEQTDVAEAEKRSENRKQFLASLRELAKKAADELQAAKALVKRFDAEHIDRVENEVRQRQTFRAEIQQLTRALEVKVALAAKLEAERDRLELRLRGVELREGVGAANAELLSELLKEVRELRREVQELKRK